MPLDLDAIRARLALDDDFRFLARAREDIAALLEEVEALRSEIAPWQTLSEKLGRQNDNMLSEIGRCCRALAATAEENTSLDRNLKDCVNFMRDLWPVIGVDLNALRLEPDRAAAIEVVRRAIETKGRA